ncbi:MAG: PilN domain-containing protein [Lentisphaeria bacterium]|nr:PilN domain-containing protein [Lentisphaeria bacterium]
MKFFPPRQSIGVTWHADGSCRAVKLRKTDSGYRVVSYWSGGAGDSSDVPALLGVGLEALGDDGNTVIVVGGGDPTVAMADVSVPAMASHDLRNALRYEVGKHAPLAEDDLAWGYRIIGGKDARLTVRLYYSRVSEWERWASAVAAMPRGIDMLIPPMAAMDPVLGDIAVEESGLPGLAFAPPLGNQTGRELLPFDDGAGVFGALPAPLAAPGLELGDLAAAPEGDQRGFAGAVILAMYGLAGTIKRDAGTCPKLPAGFRLARNRGSRLLATVLSCYLLTIVALTLGVKYYAAAAELRDVQATNAALRETLDELEKTIRPDTVFESLQDEFNILAAGGGVSLPKTLMALTGLLDEGFWISNFNWKNGAVEIDVRSAEDNTDFLRTLEESGQFADIVPLRKVVDHKNTMTVKVRMRPIAADERVTQ